MVILYLYLKNKLGNITACVPFRYNIDDEKVIDSREIILEVGDDVTYDSLKQDVVQLLDKEKMDYGKYANEFSGDMSSVVTIQ